MRGLLCILLSLFLAPTLPADSAALTWTTRSGKAISGQILSQQKGQIAIGAHGEKSTKVKVTDLVEEDQARVAEWRKTNTAPAKFGKPDKVIVIKTVPLKMLYDVTSFTVAPGAKVQLIVVNNDEMQHNLLICKKESKNGMDVAEAAIALGGEGMAAHWVPKHKNLLHATQLINPATQQSIFFTAPKAKGVYPYVCSVPGHATLMNGKMTVGAVSSFSRLSYKAYKGAGWNKLPDFPTLTPIAEGDAPDKLIDIKLAKSKNDFGLVFEGDLVVPKDAQYKFSLSSDDGSRLLVNDKQVIDNDKIHAATSVDGKVDLTAGTHSVRVEYFDKSGQISLALSWSGGGIKNQKLSVGAPPAKRGKGGSAVIMLTPTKDEAIIYRNFIEGVSARGITVGYPEGAHLAFDASTMHLALMWQGDFMNAGRHWSGRGQGNQPPAGENVVKLPQFHQFGILADDDAVWPDAPSRAANEVNKSDLRFKGYRLDARRFPTFMYSLANAKIEDFPSPIADGSGFTRALSVKGAGDKVFFRPAWGSIEKTDAGYVVDGKIVLSITGAEFIQRAHGKTQELLVAIPPGDSEFSLKYVFTEAGE
ncbi:MAG: azurin [Rhodothermales bacterium]|jgi:azurin